MRPALDNLAVAYANTQATANTAPWLSAVHASAWESVTKSGLPWRKDEHWKYTSLYDLARIPLITADQDTASHAEDASRRTAAIFSAEKAHVVSLLNGKLTSPGTNSVAGLTVELLNDAASAASVLSAGVPRDSVMLDLNHAFVQHLVKVTVSRDFDRSTPLYLHYHSHGDNILSSPRVHIVVEDNAGVDLIEHFSGSGNQSVTNTRVSMQLGKNVQVNHSRLQTADRSAHVFHNSHIKVNRDSRYESLVIDLGARLARSDMAVSLDGTGAECQLLGVFLPHDHQHFDHHTLTDHNVAHTNSEQNYHGVAASHGRGVFNGKVHVKQDAQKIVALQSNDNILLTENAEIDTKPELEIYADDVKCAHGATVGQLNADATFYLQSRGLGKKEAQHLLIRGFIRDIYKDIRNPDLREYLDQQIELKLTALAEHLA